jgi:RNase P protein component
MDASFKKHERLCKKKEFDALFSSSKVLSSQNIKVVFAFLNTPDKPVVKVAFSVSSNITEKINICYIRC